MKTVRKAVEGALLAAGLIVLAGPAWCGDDCDPIFKSCGPVQENQQTRQSTEPAKGDCEGPREEAKDARMKLREENASIRKAFEDQMAALKKELKGPKGPDSHAARVAKIEELRALKSEYHAALDAKKKGIRDKVPEECRRARPQKDGDEKGGKRQGKGGR
ncbi:MAG: hypothetical protein HYZ75_14660 [Elusimicrobia bacterium]|nr:hypothetical protein [Elusimicrobiota bacterium]